jgi:hypothetical protein
LSEVVPDGNYYTDWIADELFIVFHATENIEANQLVNYALKFSYKLIQSREDFSNSYGIPKAIDIGLSAGEALLGLMGPDGHKKATALGEIPGRSRRLQTAGKLLRSEYGENDRIVFGEDCLFGMTMGFDIKEHSLGSNSIRDVDDREFFYIEPTADEDIAEIPTLLKKIS